MLTKKQSLDSIILHPFSKRHEEACQHKKIVTSTDQLNNCYFCGIYISDDRSCKTYRTSKTKYNCFMDVSLFLTSLTKKTFKKVKISADSIYLKYRSALIDLNNATSHKLGFSLNSFYLSIHYLDSIMSKKDNNIPLSSLNTYAITCLLIAAKTIELDERIPYISKLIKYSGQDLSVEEIRQVEKWILELLNWELQTCTLLDIVEFYLAQGVLFSTDELQGKEEEISSFKVLSEKDFNSKEAKVIEIAMKNLKLNSKDSKPQKVQSLTEIQINTMLANIEYQAYNLLGLILKDPMFIEKDFKILAAGFVAYLRKISKIRNPWNKELFNISNGIVELEINEILQAFSEKFEPKSMPMHTKKEENSITLPKIKTPSKIAKEGGYFSKISHDYKAANFLLK